MNFDSSMMYYIGCFLLCVCIVLIITFFIHIKKIIKNQERMIENCQGYGYQIAIINDRLQNIDNDIYAMNMGNRQ